MQMFSGYDMFPIPSSSINGFPKEPPSDHTFIPPNSNPKPPPKKRRNLPGNPDPDAEVIALSPKTLMATNRFVCEICNKGFQRDQNLQLHRRGHNLPWKLKQRSKLDNQPVRKKVYVCPEKSCAHNDPSRALGDLTGIKKHFSRKHGEKKWKCDKCSKKYAVQSDWKAHSKTCGTREYKCDCGTLFSRKDSFITHRAFCDALAEESARIPPNLNFKNESVSSNGAAGISPFNLTEGYVHHANSQIEMGLGSNFSNLPDLVQMGNSSLFGQSPFSCYDHQEWLSNNMDQKHISNIIIPSTRSANLSLSASHQLKSSSSPESSTGMMMSATALLQKAAQMGSTRSNPSFLSHTFGLMNSSSSLSSSSSSSSSSSLASLSPGDHQMMTGGCNLEQIMMHNGGNSYPGLIFPMKMNQRSNYMENGGLTRDFLGMEAGEGGGVRPLLAQELATLASIGSSGGGLDHFGNFQ